MRVATDIGGTFTDIVTIDEHGNVCVDKCHTTPPNFEKGVIDVIVKSGTDPESVQSLTHGTTVVINALTEKKGAKTALLTTRGFRDILEMGRGNRPDLFNIRFEKPKPFVPRYLRYEVEERMDYRGNVITPLNEQSVSDAIEYFKSEGVEAVAVTYLHSYVNDSHERQTVELIKKLWPEVYVTASYEVTKEWREYERTNTTVLNSYVKPVANLYINKLYNELESIGIHCPKYIMQSNGGTTTFEKTKEIPINMVESGPVAGIFGSAILGQLIGDSRIIAFDIGGTTAKCSLIDDGEVKVSTDYKIDKTYNTAGYPIKVPVVDIVEIGNGGGSIAWIDDKNSLRVGPQSSGAVPGPVAYGLGGENPTTTDANLVIGRLSPINFDMVVDMDAVKKSIDEKIAAPFGIGTVDAAMGIVRIANSNMLNALKLISVRKGYDPREFTMVAFGGGGAMHACALAKELGVKKVVVPVAASVFSAWGMLMTDLRQDDIQTFNFRMDSEDFTELNEKWSEMETFAAEEFAEKGVSLSDVVFARYLDMRYQGQEHTVKVQVGNSDLNLENVDEIVQRFHIEHEKAYSFRIDDSLTEIVNLHLTSFGKLEKVKIKEMENNSNSVGDCLKETREVVFEETGSIETAIYDRFKLSPGTMMEGPCIIEEPTTSIVVHPGMNASIDKYGNIVINTGV